MEILYVSRLCSGRRLDALMARIPARPPLQEQKFHGLLAGGLAEAGSNVTALSLLPPDPGAPEPRREEERGIAFHYLRTWGLPLGSHVSAFLRGLLATLAWRSERSGRPCCVVCDALDLSISTGALAAARGTGVPVVAIVTDLPAYLQDYTGRRRTIFGRLLMGAYRRLSTGFLRRYSGYILLTEAMNGTVNPEDRPYLVMEGLVDSGMRVVENRLEGKFSEQVVLYAGALSGRYGVAMLLEAFHRLHTDQARLWLFGSGELERVIRDFEARDPRIKYWGVRPNAEVVAAEIRATILVNPRPSSGAFTRFSFPSKSLEYMVSGTPMLTTRLPGMPASFLDHVYTFEDESAEGLSEVLRDLLTRPKEELHQVGLQAKEFVLARMNHGVQGERVLDLIRSLAPRRSRGDYPEEPGGGARDHVRLTSVNKDQFNKIN
jgi:glycosyltransferase involved in cell wall biosynthesis